MTTVRQNTAWLYIGNKNWTLEDTEKLVEWCARHRVGKLLLHLHDWTNPAAEFAEQMDSVVEACSTAGIEIHGMIGTLQLRAEDRASLPFQSREAYCVDYEGISNWDEPLAGRRYVLDPSNPDVVSFIAGRCKDMLVKHPGLAGIHLDFIRYYHYESRLSIDTNQAGHWTVIPRAGEPLKLTTANGTTTTFFVEQALNHYNDPPIGRHLHLRRSYHYCFCKRCLERFAREFNLSIPDELEETRQRADWILKHHAEDWYAFRSSLITGVVRYIRREITAQRKEAQLSAAIWYNSPYGNELRNEPFHPGSEYEQFGQKWWEWIKEGLMDFVCPMNYWLTPESFGQIIREQVARSENKVPLYAGLLRSDEFPIDQPLWEKYKLVAQEAGAAGISFFSYGGWKDLDS